MTPTKPHFSYWLIAGAGLLWNLMGCLNYITQTNPDSVAKMPEVYQIIINGRPSWATMAFGLAVFGGAVGCILMLLRRRQAMFALALSLVGVVVTAAFTTMLVGVVPSVMLSILMALALIWYASIARRQGWLR